MKQIFVFYADIQFLLRDIEQAGVSAYVDVSFEPLGSVSCTELARVSEKTEDG